MILSNVYAMKCTVDKMQLCKKKIKQDLCYSLYALILQRISMIVLYYNIYCVK